MTEGNAEQLEFHALGRRTVVGKFDVGNISSDGGGLLLGKVEARTRIVERLAEQFIDHRDPEAIEHRDCESILRGPYQKGEIGKLRPASTPNLPEEPRENHAAEQ